MAMVPVGVAKQEEVQEPQEWAAYPVRKADSCGQHMVRKAKLCGAWHKKRLKKNLRMRARTLSHQKSLLLLWATFVHIREMKIGAPASLEPGMHMAPSITWTSLSTQTVSHTADLSPTRTLSSPESTAPGTSNSDTTQCRGVARRVPKLKRDLKKVVSPHMRQAAAFSPPL